VTDLALTGGYVDASGGGTITWQIANLGAMDANGVLFVSHLPASVSVQSVSASPGGSCTQSPAFLGSTRLQCTLNVLPSGQSWAVTAVITANAGSAKTAARVMFNGKDPVQANNYAQVAMTISNANPGGGGSGGSGGSGGNGGGSTLAPVPPPVLDLPTRVVTGGNKMPDPE